MKKDKRKVQIYLMIVFTVAILIGVGYAILTSNLNISGNTTIKENTWDIHFENLKTSTIGTVENLTTTPDSTSITSESKTASITFTGTLKTPIV